jgi:hypothetical protein
MKRFIRTLSQKSAEGKVAHAVGEALEELPLWSNPLCSLGFDGDKFVAQLFGLPFEFCFQPFLPLGVSGGSQGLVIFDLVFDHRVKDHGDLVGSCHGGSLGAQLGFHSAQVVA